MSFEFLDCMALATSTAERVFSILQCFTAQQQSSLEDYLELSVMLQYNLSLDSLIFSCTLITVCKKKEFLESKMGERESKMGESEKQNR